MLSRRLLLISLVALSSLVGSTPIEIAEGSVALQLPSSVWLLQVGTIVSFVGLDFQPAALMPLCSFTPLHVILRVFLVDNDFYERARETLCKCAHIGGVIEIHAGTVGKTFKTSDILVDFPVFHLPLLQGVLGLFLLSKVCECMEEVLHHDFPGQMSHELSWVLFDGI